MITPEPPAGSEHYREGWRHGYEQAAIDRERSADTVRLVPAGAEGDTPTAPAAGDAWHEALRRLDALAGVYTGYARIEEIRSWVERGGDGAAEAADALTGGLVPDTDPDSVVGGLPDGAIRYCDWPGCMDRVDTINGPVANGWRQTRRLLLCPDHSVREHWADYFKTEDGADAAGVWCTCGHRWNERPVNLNVLRAWWQQHVGTLGTQPSTDTVQAPDVAARADDAVVAEAARRLIEASYTRRHDPVLSGGAGVHLRWLASWMHGPRRAEVAEVARALLGTDTTPDRLAWISEAGETAAAERQARYQETACARRPAEETPDA